MQGQLSGLQLAELLQVVGLSRQFTAVELTDTEGGVVGSILLKSGKVLRVESKNGQGRVGFFNLFSAPTGRFHVWRMPDPKAFPSPLGSLDHLLMEALDRELKPHPHQVVPQPKDPIQGENTARQPMPTAHDPGPRGEAAATREPMPARHAPQRRAPSVPPPNLPSPQQAPPTTKVATVPAAEASSVPRASSSSSAKFSRPTAVVTKSRAPVAASAASTAPATPEAKAPAAQRNVVVTKTTSSQPAVVIAVASPKGGVGKTTIALNLALAMAKQGFETLLVDADANGDVLSSIDARGQVERGVFDILDAPGRLSEILRNTAEPGLRIAAATGHSLPESVVPSAAQHEQWRALLAEGRKLAPVVIVDCPAGMFGTTLSVLHGATHVLGVVQAEMLASRSFEMFQRGMERVREADRPSLSGVVVNMLQTRSATSIDALQRIAREADRQRLYETTIPRSEGFQQAVHAGQPVSMSRGGQPHAVSWLFDMLASEVRGRTLNNEPAAHEPRPFLH